MSADWEDHATAAIRRSAGGNPLDLIEGSAMQRLSDLVEDTRADAASLAAALLEDSLRRLHAAGIRRAADLGPDVARRAVRKAGGRTE